MRIYEKDAISHSSKLKTAKLSGVTMMRVRKIISGMNEIVSNSIELYSLKIKTVLFVS